MMGPGFAAAAISSWLEPLGVLLFSMITIVVLGTVTTLYVSHQHELKAKAFTQECVDAGGMPVITYQYVKGSKDGHLCINPSAIIQLKDEVK